jgi:hypothetical protein
VALAKDLVLEENEEALKLTSFREDFCGTVGQVMGGQKRYLVLRYGRPVAALVSMADLRALRLSSVQVSDDIAKTT